VARSGFVATPITKEPPDASQKIMASAKTPFRLAVANSSYCFAYCLLIACS